eukprot:1243008-Pyramimonas_sp.AAC.1
MANARPAWPINESGGRGTTRPRATILDRPEPRQLIHYCITTTFNSEIAANILIPKSKSDLQEEK